MNCVQLALEHVADSPHRPAIWLPGASGSASQATFSELFSLASAMQRSLRTSGVKAGDVVLVADRLSVRFYAAVFAILGLGATVALIEPWMAAGRIERAAHAVKPRFFLGSWAGRLWGLRYRAVRRIPHKLNMRTLTQQVSGLEFIVEDVDEQAAGIITFTSGTTGDPKGVVRTQGALVRQLQVLRRSLNAADLAGPDLCIFANFVLANLACGRTSLLLPDPWKAARLRQIDQLPASLQPDSLTCGPAFLLTMMQHARIPTLKSVHVGGALTDCWIFEKAFARWPHAHWMQLYGSTEAEPVATTEAKSAVRRSREKGYFQTLCLGRPVAEIACQFEERGIWVHGPHVCGPYMGNADANRTDKRTDKDGLAWHFMGDRVRRCEGSGEWWYRGRSDQAEHDFELEQRIYSALQSSECFIHRTRAGELLLVGEVDANTQLPGVDRVIPKRIFRDRRHRSRIDRPRSLSGTRGGAKWAPG